MKSRPVKLLGATLVGALAASASAQIPSAPQEPSLPPQHQAIRGLYAPAKESTSQAGLRIIAVASPAPDAINMHIVETPRGLVLFDALRRANQVADILSVLERLKKPPLALFITHAHTDHYGGIAFLRAFSTFTCLCDACRCRRDAQRFQRGQQSAARTLWRTLPNPGADQRQLAQSLNPQRSAH